MSLITPYQINRTDLSQDEVDDLVNEMLVPEIDFAAKCSLFHRFFGVITGGKEGEQTFVTDLSATNASGHPDKFLLNACARFAYPRLAQEIGSEMEAAVGYTLTPRYVTEEVPFQSFDWPPHFRLPGTSLGKNTGIPFLAPNWRFKTLLPGVEEMGVIPVWGSPAGYEEIDVSPFIQTNLTAVASPIDDNTPMLRIDDNLAPNPNDVILRKVSNNAFVPTFTNDTFQITRDIGTYWEIPLDKSTAGFNISTDRVNVQHRKYVIVDIPAPTLTSGQTFWPVYPGTHQKIPQAKPMQVIGDTWRFTFYIYTLVHHEFVAESTNLIAGEYYKLYPFISFKTFEEEAVLPTLVIVRGDTEETLEPTLTLVDQQYGIFHLNYDLCTHNPTYQCLCQDWPETIRLRYSYKTNPSHLPLVFRSQISSLREAIAARIAAELPTDDCGCPVPFGYLNEMQFVFSDTYIDTQSRMAVEKLRYGTLRGQLIYTRAVNNALKFKAPVLAKLRS